MRKPGPNVHEDIKNANTLYIKANFILVCFTNLLFVFEKNYLLCKWKAFSFSLHVPKI